MRNSANSISEIKNISGRRSIRNNEGLSSHKNVNNNEDRSISEPPQSYSTYENHHKMSFKSTAPVQATTSGSRLKPIREKIDDDGRFDEDEQRSSEDEDDLSKSNSQLNESDLDIPDSVSQTPTPTPLGTGARRINSETNLNDSKRRMTGFMGNKSKRFCASTSELSFTSHLDTRKSLFSPKNNQRSLSRSSLYGSNTSLNSTNSRLFMVNSPFYNGKTMFGGASAYPKRDFNQQHQPSHSKVLRTPIQMRPSSSLSNSSITSTKSDSVLPESNAAKRILEIMTQFNGPLKEVRSMGSNINSIMKLPGLVQNRKRFGEEELNLDRSIRASTAPYGRPILGKERSESSLQGIAAAVSNATTKPQIPTMSQLLQMKRLQYNTERVREIANRSQSFLNQVQDYKLPNDIQSNYGMAPNSTSNSSSSLKIKNNFTKNLLRSDKSAVDQLPPTPLNLPNIQLPELKSIPKFDIQLPSTPPASSTHKQPTNSSKSISPSTGAPTMSFINAPSFNSKSFENFNKKTNCSDFQFSNPIKLSSDFDTKKLMSVTDRFIFSKPSIIEVNAISKEMKEVPLPPFSSSKSSGPLSDDLFKNLAAKQKSQWECDSCLTRNDSEKTKCLCCEQPRPGSDNNKQSSSSALQESPFKANTSTPLPVADDFFKNLAAKQKSTQWECDVCMCKNGLGKDKCMSCESPKPGSKPQTTSSLPATNFKFGMPSDVSISATTTTTTTKTSAPVASDDLFKSLVAQQKKTRWECDVCMTGNDVSSEKCVACETPKPGSKSEAVKPASTFSFGMPAASITTTSAQSFSFGMPPVAPASSVDPEMKKILDKQNAKWECDVCMTRNDPVHSKCLSCEHPKPGATSQPQFLFGSNKMSSGIALPKPSEVKFTFGVQPVVVAATTTNKTETAKTSEKVEELKDEVDKPKTFSFGTAPSTTVTPTVVSSSQSSSTITSVSDSTPSFTFKAPAAAVTTTPLSTNAISASFTIKSPPKPVEKKEEVVKPPMPFSFGSKVEEKIASIVTSDSIEKTEEKKVAASATTPVFGGFKFGSTGSEEVKKDSEKPSSGGFSFGTSANLSFGTPAVVSTTSATSTTSKYTFGSPSKTPIAETKTSFGGFSSQPAVTTTPNATSTFSFGTPSTVAKIVPTTPSFSFGATAKKETEVTTQASSISTQVTTGTFSFGSNANKPAASPSGGFSFNSPSSSVFGSQIAAPSSSNPTTNTTTNSTSTFSFGASKPAEEVKSTFGGFGTVSANSSPFGGASQASQSPIFGQAAASTPTFGFGTGNNKEPVASSVFAFGAKPSVTPSTQTMIFGSNAASSTPNITPVFGANAPSATFGASMGATSNNNNNNNESGFGSKMIGFGGIGNSTMANASHKRAFDFGSAQPDVPHKKFEFGSHQQQQQQQQQHQIQPQTNSSPFQFNAQPQIQQQQQPSSVDSGRPAFSFNATSPATFNFTAGTNVNSNAVQENLFQFGTNTLPAQGIYAFGANTQQQAQSAPVMQFGNAGAPSIAIPGINAFSAQQTNATNPNRKILRAARRTNLQRR